MSIWLIVFAVSLATFIILAIVFSIEESRQKRFGEPLRKKLDLLIIRFVSSRSRLGVKFGCGSARLIMHHLLKRFLKIGLSLVRHSETTLKHLSHANSKAAKNLNKEMMSVMKERDYFGRKGNRQR